MALTTHRHLIVRLGKNVAKYLLPLCAFMALTESTLLFGSVEAALNRFRKVPSSELSSSVKEGKFTDRLSYYKFCKTL
jgi:hypothetical protein